jgi:hypothetical protein
MKNRLFILAGIFLLNISAISIAQGDWEVPESDKGKLSLLMFDEDIAFEGNQIYAVSCISCHGNPTQANYTIMSPPPGDVSEERFQIQVDGELFYKIQKGRGAMPSFENSYSENEIWTMVAYIRSFDENYVQLLPDLEGIEIPVLELLLGYDENVDKLVVKISDDKNDKSAGVTVKAYIKGLFGNHFLGKVESNEEGIAYFDIDAKIPGDEEGFVDVIVKASKGYGSAKVEEKIQAGLPSVFVSITEGRHLWSTAKKAPIWMIVIFNLIGAGIWIVIIYILFGLRKIRKLQ